MGTSTRHDNALVDPRHLTLLGRIVVPWAIRHRNDLVVRRIRSLGDAPCDSLLDVGCGPGYLIERAPCRHCVGIDQQGCITVEKDNRGGVVPRETSPGVVVTEHLPFPDRAFNYVTLIAVIEHLEKPVEILREIHRVLKPSGFLLATTPKPVVELVVKLLDKGSEQLRGRSVHEEHETYFDRDSVAIATRGFFTIQEYRTFQLGINQLFVLRKV